MLQEERRRQGPPPNPAAQQGDDWGFDGFDPAGASSAVVFVGAAAGLACLVLLAASSIGAVPPLNYGIRYNRYNKYADIDHVWSPGRHLIGPWNVFLLFPANVQTVEFTSTTALAPMGVRYPALHTRTKEGLALHLQVSLQYRLIGDRVGHLYMEFNKDYQSMFIATIRDTLIRAASEYEAAQFWEEREHVGQNMQNMVNRALERTYATCWGLQLMVIELPTKFEESIVATQVQNQQVDTQRYAQTAAKVRAVTQVINAEFEQKVKVIKAHGKANYTVNTKVARAEARSKVLDTETEMLALIKSGLGLSPEDLVVYQQYSAMRLLSNASLFYGFAEEAASVLMGGLADASADGSASLGGVGASGGVERRLSNAAENAYAVAHADAASEGSPVAGHPTEEL